MFREYPLAMVNNHIIIDDGQHLLLDTGSPISFHSSGFIEFGDETFHVKKSLQMLSKGYLKEEVCDSIEGILGMDIINRFPVVISLKNSFMYRTDEAFNCHRFICPDNSMFLGGLINIEITLNNKKANMILDTGAPISYIHPSFIDGIIPEEVKEDFSPYLGTFQTSLYRCRIDSKVFNSPYHLKMGTLPSAMEEPLTKIGVDGILGVEFFKEFRLGIKQGHVYFLPQGI